MNIKLLLVLLLLAVVLGCNIRTRTKNVVFSSESKPTYSVVHRSGSMAINGHLSETTWMNVPKISSAMHYPWEQKQSPETSFQSFHDGKNFYFAFRVKDREILVNEEWKYGESTLNTEDRVEIFLAEQAIDMEKDGSLLPYYAIEIDPKGRVHDYKVLYYRQFDASWDLKGLKVASIQTGIGYVVEGLIPLSTLHELNLFDENRSIRVGLFRAEFSRDSSELKMQWISWVHPKSSFPDFHIDSAFGQFEFAQF